MEMYSDYLQHETHVWYIKPESIQNKEVLGEFKDILSKDELARYERFYFPKDKHQFLVSHGLIRQVLSKYSLISPRQLEYIRTRHGRPELANQKNLNIRFNLTHTQGLTACVVTLDQDCGIDAEQITDRRNLLGIAQRMFSKAEFCELQELTDRAFLEYFFSQWTLRESYVKAIGVGLTFPTHKLCFENINNSKIKLSLDPMLKDDDDHWLFTQPRLSSEHIVSIALRQEKGTTKKIVSRAWKFQHFWNWK